MVEILKLAEKINCHLLQLKKVETATTALPSWLLEFSRSKPKRWAMYSYGRVFNHLSMMFHGSFGLPFWKV
jgi:hypothetical protein